MDAETKGAGATAMKISTSIQVKGIALPFSIFFEAYVTDDIQEIAEILTHILQLEFLLDENQEVLCKEIPKEDC